MAVRKIQTPPELNRNCRRVAEAGVEETGAAVLANVVDVLGVPDLSKLSMLDVGCGVRFTQTIINRGIPIRSYVGVDVEPKVIEWLKKNVDDPRFSYALWDVQNAMYNKRGTPFTRDSRLPVEGRFDLICLFSVFTHLSPADSDAMLHVLRPHAAPNGRLLFTASLNDAVESFADEKPDKPLNVATYSDAYLRKMIEANGWRVVKSIPPRKASYVMHQFLCEPA